MKRLYKVNEESARRELEQFNERILNELVSSKDLAIAFDFLILWTGNLIIERIEFSFRVARR
ncbi:hypothetical protein AKJ57_02085 [candidate division MSBL1 archaeon SCGC-AAA259A05]|uniref:Uncharacterized protein n=1 Tax=candidate division MSBL1 archaeon SCGC-AAA259A05 TaxID=1698259 RepID=A0A133UAK6_9EURY|nr:hypothetical protein AKJ57_02085 [candidate division MSBL1 archaeon SCGC-AAA259A05]